MEFREYLIDEKKEELQNCQKAMPDLSKPVCFFDIETTGLSPKISSLYLIGAAFFDGSHYILKQWFADDYVSEKQLLLSFSEFCRPFSGFVHFNGTTFDIPYLEKKYTAYHLPSPFEQKDSLDLYRKIRNKKALFAVPDMKLQTLEKRLCFHRHDTYTGKDCIRLYTEYMQRKYFRDVKAEELKQKLFLHNHDDLLGTILCCQLLPYAFCHPKRLSFQIKQTFVVVQGELSFTFPFSVQYDNDTGVRFHMHQSEVCVEIPLFHGTLYHFYPDYKNYFYLPKEDTAIHKSVGIYVDAAYRQKAAAANCYTKKDGAFFPFPKNVTPAGLTAFQKDRKDARIFVSAEETVSSFTDAHCLSLLQGWLQE